MIIFFNKLTKRIFGTLEGRVHTPQQLNAFSMTSDEHPEESVGKYVVPYEPEYEEIEIPTEEWRVVDNLTQKVGKVVVGTQKVTQVKQLLPNVPFKDTILDFESGKQSALDYDVVTDENDNVVGFKKRDTQ